MEAPNRVALQKTTGWTAGILRRRRTSEAW